MPLFHSNAVQVGWAPSLVTPCAVGLGRRFSASGWLPDIRRYGSTYFNYTGKPLAYLLAQPEQRRRRRQHVARRVRQRGLAGGRRDVRAAVRLEVIDAYGATEGGVAVNRDAEQRAGALGLAPDHVQIVDEDGNEKATRAARRARPGAQRRRVRRRDRQHAGRRSVRGLLQQPRRNREDDALRVVLVGRPRLQGRRRLPVLRGPQRGLDPRRRRELPGRPDRGGAAARARCRARGGLRRPRRPGRRPGDGRPRPRRRRDVRSGRVRRVARRAGGDRAEVAAALRARAARPADDRHEQDRQAHARAARSSGTTSSTATRCTCAIAATPTYRPFTAGRRAGARTSRSCATERERFWDL